MGGLVSRSLLDDLRVAEDQVSPPRGASLSILLCATHSFGIGLGSSIGQARIRVRTWCEGRVGADVGRQSGTTRPWPCRCPALVSCCPLDVCRVVACVAWQMEV